MDGEAASEVNPTQQEIDVKEPLKLRFHHIRNLLSFENLLNKGMDPRSADFIPLDSLYRNPKITHALNQEQTEMWVNTLNQLRAGVVEKGTTSLNAEEAKNYAIDILGTSEEDTINFLKSFPKAIDRLLSAQPNEVVELTEGIDLICNSCQGNGTNKPGDHCIRPPAVGKPNDDVTYYKAVEKFRVNHTSADSKTDIEEVTDEQGRHAFRLNMGTLRSSAFLRETTSHHFMYKSGTDIKPYPIPKAPITSR